MGWRGFWLHFVCFCFRTEKFPLFASLLPSPFLLPNDVVVVVELLQEHDLPERALRVGRILKGVENFLYRHRLAGRAVDGAPDYPVSLNESGVGRVRSGGAAAPRAGEWGRPALVRRRRPRPRRRRGYPNVRTSTECVRPRLGPRPPLKCASRHSPPCPASLGRRISSRLQGQSLLELPWPRGAGRGGARRDSVRAPRETAAAPGVGGARGGPPGAARDRERGARARAGWRALWARAGARAAKALQARLSSLSSLLTAPP